MPERVFPDKKAIYLPLSRVKLTYFECGQRQHIKKRCPLYILNDNVKKGCCHDDDEGNAEKTREKNSEQNIDESNSHSPFLEERKLFPKMKN